MSVPLLKIFRKVLFSDPFIRQSFIFDDFRNDRSGSLTTAWRLYEIFEEQEHRLIKIDKFVPENLISGLAELQERKSVLLDLAKTEIIFWQSIAAEKVGHDFARERIHAIFDRFRKSDLANMSFKQGEIDELQQLAFEHLKKFDADYKGPLSVQCKFGLTLLHHNL